MNTDERILLEIRDLLQQLLDRFDLAYQDQMRIAKQRAEQTMGDRNSMKRRIYEMLDGKRGVNEIAKLLRTSQPNVSTHIKDLVEAGLVSMKIEGGKRSYRRKWEAG